MALSPEDKAEMRAMMVSVVGGATDSLQSQIGDRIGSLQKDVTSILDRLDVIETDTTAIRRQLARLIRERADDTNRAVALTKRVVAIEDQIDKGPPT